MLSALVAGRSQRKKLSNELRQDGYFYTTLYQLFKIKIHASLIGKKIFFCVSNLMIIDSFCEPPTSIAPLKFL